jgi:hypothetical protein
MCQFLTKDEKLNDKKHQYTTDNAMEFLRSILKAMCVCVCGLYLPSTWTGPTCIELPHNERDVNV